MEIRESRTGDIVIVEPVGRLDTKTSIDLEEKLAELMKQDERRFVIDLEEIEYISSAGLRVLLMVAKKLTGTEGEVCLCSLNAQVREVFDIAGFTGVFTITASRAAALEAVSSRSSGASKISMLAARLLGTPRTGATPRSEQTQPGSRKISELSVLAARLLARGSERKPSQRAAAPPSSQRAQSPSQQSRAQRSKSLWERIVSWFPASRG